MIPLYKYQATASIPTADLAQEFPNPARLLQAMGLTHRIQEKLLWQPDTNLLVYSLKYSKVPCVKFVVDLKDFVQDNEDMVVGILGIVLVNEIKLFV